MVRPQDAGDLTPEDYLWPMTVIRDTVLRPNVERHIPRGKLVPLLRWHLPRLQTPWAPFSGPSEASRKAVGGTSVAVPGASGAKLDVDEGSRSIALRLSEAAGIDQVWALLLWKSYAMHSVDDAVGIAPAPKDSKDEAALLDRLLAWYELELLAVPQTVMALYFDPGAAGASDPDTDLKREIVGDEARYIEELFRAFAGLAQRPVDESRMKRGLFWATLQLRQQETLLDLLFLILYYYTTRPAAVSEGLVKGAVASTFGTAQANREVWENDAECQRVAMRVRDLVLVIAVESLCLAQIVSPEGEDDEGGNTFGATLLHSRDRIHAVHEFILEQSQDLDGPDDASGADMVFPQWPMPVLCLAWAIVLRYLPPNLQPPTSDYFHLDTSDMETGEPLAYIGVATRALRLSSGLFPWFEVVLQGPLFQTAKDAFSGDLADDMAALRRSPLKDLLIGLSELVRIDMITDRPGLYRAWELVFGGGSRQASSSLSANYWSVDFVYDDRRAILDRSRFPREPLHLPSLLAALTGVSAEDVLDGASGPSVTDVHQYFGHLPFVTLTAPRSTFVFDGLEDTFRAVESTCDIVLPGGNVIPRRTRGYAISDEDDDEVVVTWAFRQPGWMLLLEILRGAANLAPVKTKSVAPAQARRLTLEALGVQGSLPEILSCGLKLLRCVLRSAGAAEVLAGAGSGAFGRSLLELALNVASRRDDPLAAQYAIDILESLLLTGAHDIWQQFRGSGFFDSASRRQGSVAALVQSDAARGQHGLTVALLRLVRSLATANAGDPLVVRSAVKLVFSEVWCQFSGWRYRDIAKRYEIAALLLGIFDGVLRHPLADDGASPTHAAAYLLDVFIKGASPLTYKPIVDVFTQSTQQVTKLVQARRWTDATAVGETFDNAASLLATLIRVAPRLNVPVSALPFSVFNSTVAEPGSGDRIQLVDLLFDLIANPLLQTPSLRLLLRLVRVYLLSTTNESHRLSLAGMLRRADVSMAKLADIAFHSGPDDVKADAWALLATIIRTQPGCAPFCIASKHAHKHSKDESKEKEEKLSGPLQMAADEIAEWKTVMQTAPRALAAVLFYCQAVLDSPSASASIATLRKDGAFWQGVMDISIKHVPKPSLLSGDIVAGVQDYSYAVQAKANAAGLLAAELALVLDNDGPETKAQSLVLSLFRNTNALEDVSLGAIRTSCDPELHAREDQVVKDLGINLLCARTIYLPDERIYGAQYFYDRPVVFLNDGERQAAAGRAFIILNLNWSQLDADIAYTKSFRLLAEVVSGWTKGDDLSAKACLRAATAVSHELADEDQGGDVMLAIQTERLAILAILLDTGIDPETEAGDPAVVKELAKSVRRIVESTLFDPMLSLRHPELAHIHAPVLRILLLLSQAKTGAAAEDVLELLFDSGASFALDAADCILDWIVRDPTVAVEQDLGLVVALLCEMSRVPSSLGVWLDKLMQGNLIPRSLEVIVRTRPVNGVLPSHVHTILLLHLAIASKTATAEKLAVSGLLPAYSDNVIAVAAEAASIDVSGPNTSLHRAWCGMLLVVKALLAALATRGGTFARTDVVPWVRVVLPQMLHALEWNGESLLSRPALDEMGLIVDVFYGLADAVGGGSGNGGATRAAGRGAHDPYSLLDEFAPAAVELLRGVRYALSHPHQFCTLIAPATEDEQVALEKELLAVEKQKDDSINLVDDKTPVIARVTRELVEVACSVLVTLVRFTRAWRVVDGDQEPQPELLLPYDDASVLSAATDPIGVINEVFLQLQTIASALPGANGASARRGAEAAALLSLTQLLGRRALSPAPPAEHAMDIDGGGGGSIATSTSTKRRLSLPAPADRAATVLRELESDVTSMLPTRSDSALIQVLRGLADAEFGTDA